MSSAHVGAGAGDGGSVGVTGVGVGSGATGTGVGGGGGQTGFSSVPVHPAGGACALAAPANPRTMPAAPTAMIVFVLTGVLLKLGCDHLYPLRVLRNEAGHIFLLVQ